MNRIYQGKVTAVEIPDGKDERGQPNWKKIDDWQLVLWQHHQLFQDAVNYYTLCLANMAEGAGAELARSGEQKRPRVTAMLNWRKELRGQWKRASRKARHFDGPHATLIKHLKNATAEMEFEDVEKRSLRNGASAELRLAALLNLLDLVGAAGEDADLTPKARSIMPPLFQAVLKGGDAVAANRQLATSQTYARRISEAKEEQFDEIAHRLVLDCFLKTPPDPTQAYSGEKAAKRLRNCFDATVKKFPALRAIRENFEHEIARLLASDPAALQMPKGNKPPSLFHVVSVFKHLPRRETWEAVVKSSASLLKREIHAEAKSDPLFDVRIDGVPPFDYFSNLAFVSSGKPKAQGVWFEFDLMAFVEALKSPHRYYQDTQKREAEAEKLHTEIRLMEGRGQMPKDDEEQVYGFEEDKRFDLIKKLVNSEELRVEAEAEGDFTSGAPTEYGITERTLRGFDEVRQRWLALAESGEPNEEQLRGFVAEIQADHPLDFGSATLFLELTKPHYHPIWRSAATKKWHAPNALRAWMDYKELHRELQDKTRAIRFTPAHAVESPRYFNFPKASETEEKISARRAIKPGLVSRHLSGESAFYAGVVLETPTGLEPTPMKITFAAPRLLRDELRTVNSKENLYAARWLQPMIKALPYSDELDRQNFANCRVTLQPDTHDRNNIQLTFPVAIQSATLTAKIEKAARWNKQFYGFGKGRDFTRMALRWPHETKTGRKNPAWPAFDRFSLVAVDLGQRTAGAFARMLISATDSTVGARFIGETSGRKWYARLAEHELLRLAGENRKEWRDGSWCEEPFGSKGRTSMDDEIAEARALLSNFGCDEAEVLPANWEKHLSFPEINDGLLRAAKRALAHYGRLHRWRWFLTLDENKRKTAQDEMQESETGPLTEAVLDRLMNDMRSVLPSAFCKLADRILPLRGRRWSWKAHSERGDCHVLEQIEDAGTAHVRLRGQRGLSFARLEQLEELRKRFQSLNQLMRRVPGCPPNKRRDESIPDPCPDILEKLERTKEQRVNQTAHMILAEALGLALQAPPPNKAEEKHARDLHGIYRQIREPVDFIVIENLSRYRTSQGRAPRENNRLMKWSHRAIRDKLRELCEPFGVPILETTAAYSSRFCSRSGVAGFRAVELTPRALEQPRWKRLQEKIANKQPLTGDENDAARFLEMLKHSALVRNGNTLLAPQAGGPIFVPFTDSVVDADLSPALAQADINAAINLGLRAIADPRVLRIHSRVRTNKRRVEMVNGKRIVNFPVNEKRMFGDKSKAEVQFLGSNGKEENEDSRPQNFFCDVSGTVAQDKAKIIGADIPTEGNLVSAKALWSTVKERQWQRTLDINQQRLDRIAAADDSDDIPI
jgi:hypothetical protein